MSFPERDERGWSGRVSAEYGCTVTFENDGGQTLVLTGQGPPTEVLRALCAQALFADPSFRVVSYSTPETVLSDLRGRYSPGQHAKARAFQSGPEGGALSRLGLLPLLHPRARGTSRHSTGVMAAAERERDV